MGVAGGGPLFHSRASETSFWPGSLGRAADKSLMISRKYLATQKSWPHAEVAVCQTKLHYNFIWEVIAGKKEK